MAYRVDLASPRGPRRNPLRRRGATRRRRRDTAVDDAQTSAATQLLARSVTARLQLASVILAPPPPARWAPVSPREPRRGSTNGSPAPARSFPPPDERRGRVPFFV